MELSSVHQLHRIWDKVLTETPFGNCTNTMAYQTNWSTWSGTHMKGWPAELPMEDSWPGAPEWNPKRNQPVGKAQTFQLQHQAYTTLYYSSFLRQPRPQRQSHKTFINIITGHIPLVTMISGSEWANNLWLAQEHLAKGPRGQHQAEREELWQTVVNGLCSMKKEWWP